jgi:hypothetical protein
MIFLEDLIESAPISYFISVSPFSIINDKFCVFCSEKDYRFLTNSLDIDQQLKKRKLPVFSVVVSKTTGLCIPINSG